QVEPAIRPLLSGMPGVSQCLSTIELPEFDLHCALSDLPLAFETRLETIPSEVPYLRAPAARLRAWEDRLGQHDRLRGVLSGRETRLTRTTTTVRSRCTCLPPSWTAAQVSSAFRKA